MSDKTKDQGNQIHIDYANGPKEDRKCTDLFCLIIFLLFTILMIFVAAYSLKNGDP